MEVGKDMTCFTLSAQLTLANGRVKRVADPPIFPLTQPKEKQTLEVYCLLRMEESTLDTKASRGRVHNGNLMVKLE